MHTQRARFSCLIFPLNALCCIRSSLLSTQEARRSVNAAQEVSECSTGGGNCFSCVHVGLSHNCMKQKDGSVLGWPAVMAVCQLFFLLIPIWIWNNNILLSVCETQHKAEEGEWECVSLNTLIGFFFQINVYKYSILMVPSDVVILKYFIEQAAMQIQFKWTFVKIKSLCKC